MTPLLLACSKPADPVYSGDEGYEGAVAFYTREAEGTHHYFAFEEGNGRQGPFLDTGTDSVRPTLTLNNIEVAAGFQHCGAFGAPYVGGLIHSHISSITTPGWAGDSGADSIPLFTGPGAVGFFARQGSAIEKGILYARVANTGASTEYESKVEILATGVIRLTIETPAGNATITSSSAVWSSSDRMNWKHICFRQLEDGGGVDLFVNGTEVSVSRSYTGSAGADTWIDDMLAYGSRDSSEDIFRVLDRGITESNLDCYNHAGIGGLFVMNDVLLTDAQVDTIVEQADMDGDATDFVEGILKAVRANGNEWPVWWMQGNFTLRGSGLNLARPAEENNVIVKQGILDSEVGVTPATMFKRYQHTAVDGFSSSAGEYVDGDTTEAGDTWHDWNFTEGTLVLLGACPGINGTNQYAYAFWWGQQATSGPATQEYLSVQVYRNNGNIRIDFLSRATGSPTRWAREFSSTGLSTGDPMCLLVRQKADGTGPEVWLNGTELTTFTDDNTSAIDNLDADTWFSTIRTDAGGTANGFRLGAYLVTGTFQNWIDGLIEDFVIDDSAWTDAQITDFFSALTSSENYTPGGDAVTITVGVVDDGLSTEEVGFRSDGGSSSYGSASGAPSWATGAVRAVYWDNDTDEFVCEVVGLYAQDVFRELVIEAPGNAYYRMFTRAASYSQISGYTQWKFTAPTSLWAEYAASDTVTVYFDEDG